jgi:hypothetical protein
MGPGDGASEVGSRAASEVGSRAASTAPKPGCDDGGTRLAAQLEGVSKPIQALVMSELVGVLTSCRPCSWCVATHVT